jgi:predicted transglutaminase-like cysteine proteinase
MRGLHAARAALLVAAGFLAGGQSAAGDLVMLGPGELEPAKMPSGLASLCLREPGLCAPVKPVPLPLRLSEKELDLIAKINRSINHSIAAATDEELYGLEEYWTLPQGRGDCEDYVLLKRKTLSALGVPIASLLITVVNDEHGEGHAVLSIPTSAGDLVLDNRRDEILDWRATGYKFVKRQSAANPNVWVSLAREKLQATNIASAPEAPPQK